MSVESINYDALAAALLRAGLGANVGAHAECTKPTQAGLGDKSVNPAGSLRGPKAGDVGAELSDGVGGEVSGGGSVQSWADAVEEEVKPLVSDGVVESGSDSGGSVEFVGKRPSVGAAVRGTVKFGGLQDSFPSAAVVAPAASAGYYATVVRNARAVELRKLLERTCLQRLPKAALEDLAICTYAAGCMPVAVVNGKERLKSLAAVGDAALTLHLVVGQWAAGQTVESAQAVRSRVTSNTSLTSVMMKSGMVKFVSYPAGVDPGTTKATATALEAIVGVLTLYRPAEAVRMLLGSLGLLSA